MMKYITKCIYLQVKSINDSYMFPAVGSAMSDGSFGSFGGIVYSFTKNKVLLWRPANNQASGHVIYVGGKWGNGAYSTKQDVAYIKVSILYFPSKGTCTMAAEKIDNVYFLPYLQLSTLAVAATKGILFNLIVIISQSLLLPLFLND